MPSMLTSIHENKMPIYMYTLNETKYIGDILKKKKITIRIDFQQKQQQAPDFCAFKTVPFVYIC